MTSAVPCGRRRCWSTRRRSRAARPRTGRPGCTATSGGYCTHPYFSQCPHRLVCAKCSFYRPKAEMAAFVEQAKGNLLRLREELPLTEEERAEVDDDLTGYEHLLAQLADVPALDGATPRQLMSQGAALAADGSTPVDEQTG